MWPPIAGMPMDSVRMPFEFSFFAARNVGHSPIIIMSLLSTGNQTVSRVVHLDAVRVSGNYEGALIGQIADHPCLLSKFAEHCNPYKSLPPSPRVHRTSEQANFNRELLRMQIPVTSARSISAIRLNNDVQAEGRNAMNRGSQTTTIVAVSLVIKMNAL